MLIIYHSYSHSHTDGRGSEFSMLMGTSTCKLLWQEIDLIGGQPPYPASHYHSTVTNEPVYLWDVPNGFLGSSTTLLLS